MPSKPTFISVPIRQSEFDRSIFLASAKQRLDTADAVLLEAQTERQSALKAYQRAVREYCYPTISKR